MKSTPEEKLGSSPIGKLVINLAIPAIVAQLVNALYNIVDRIYIGHMPETGSLALTGVGVCFPVLMTISAFSAFIGAGAAPLAAIQLGRKNRDAADKILGNSLTALLLLFVLLTVIFIIFREPMLYVFGASSATIPYAMEYLDIYLLGTVFVLLSVGLNNFISSQGFAGTAMLSITIGAVINIILDPIFIFALGMGVRGAAIATVFSQMCSCLWVIRFLLSPKSSIRIRRQFLKIDRRVLGGIVALGISPFVMQITESLVSIVLNSSLQKYGGDAYVGAMTILQSTMQLIVIPVIGLTQGTQAIISYNYGAGNLDRVREAFKKILTLAVSSTLFCCLITLFFPAFIARIFTQNEELILLTSRVMPIFMCGTWMLGVQIACQSSIVALGKARLSLFLALLRKIILLIPLALILPRFFGVTSIFTAEPIADITAAIVTSILFIRCLKNEVGSLSDSRSAAGKN